MIANKEASNGNPTFAAQRHIHFFAWEMLNFIYKRFDISQRYLARDINKYPAVIVLWMNGNSCSLCRTR